WNMNDSHPIKRVGDDVSLTCNNVVYPNCSSTTWNYNRPGSTVTIEEVAFGKIKVDKTERADRLSLGSNCSLHVSNVRAEDAGRYTCRQYLTETGAQNGGDAPVDLVNNHILSWVPNETGTEPQKYSGSQDPQHSSCDITLTVTLQKKDNNRKWTCTLTEKGNVKISIDFTSTFSDSSDITTLIPVKTTTSTPQQYTTGNVKTAPNMFIGRTSCLVL
uniref:Ig-like domain-containing protein n=1 Tax=Hucho hucho TaxID=62062 RepID=A0A4W5Q939_9TELE